MLPEPVNVEDFRELGSFGFLADREPVVPVVAHVVTAERKHGEGVETELTLSSLSSGGHLGSNGRADHDTVVPVEGFENQGSLGLTATAEDDGVDRNTAEVVVSRVEDLKKGNKANRQRKSEKCSRKPSPFRGDNKLTGHWLEGAVKRELGWAKSGLGSPDSLDHSWPRHVMILPEGTSLVIPSHQTSPSSVKATLV